MTATVSGARGQARSPPRRDGSPPAPPPRPGPDRRRRRGWSRAGPAATLSAVAGPDAACAGAHHPGHGGRHGLGRRRRVGRPATSDRHGGRSRTPPRPPTPAPGRDAPSSAAGEPRRARPPRRRRRSARRGHRGAGPRPTGPSAVMHDAGGRHVDAGAGQAPAHRLRDGHRARASRRACTACRPTG